MKPSPLAELVGKGQNNYQINRKLKIFLGAVLVVLLLVGGLIIWAGVATVQHVANKGTIDNLQKQALTLKGEVQKLPAIAKVDCWNSVQSLLNVDIWLNNPIADILNSVKTACLSNAPLQSKGAEDAIPRSGDKRE